MLPQRSTYIVGIRLLNMNSTNETLLFYRFLIMYNLYVITCIILIFVFHCTHVRMSYVFNAYLLTYLLKFRPPLCVDTSRRQSEANVNAGFTSGEEAVPETPPPSYTSIARQISYTSNITQSSLQREFVCCFLCLGQHRQAESIMFAVYLSGHPSIQCLLSVNIYFT